MNEWDVVKLNSTACSPLLNIRLELIVQSWMMNLSQFGTMTIWVMTTVIFLSQMVDTWQTLICEAKSHWMCPTRRLIESRVLGSTWFLFFFWQRIFPIEEGEAKVRPRISDRKSKQCVNWWRNARHAIGRWMDGAHSSSSSPSSPFQTFFLLFPAILWSFFRATTNHSHPIGWSRRRRSGRKNSPTVSHRVFLFFFVSSFVDRFVLSLSLSLCLFGESIAAIKRRRKQKWYWTLAESLSRSWALFSSYFFFVIFWFSFIWWRWGVGQWGSCVVSSERLDAISVRTQQNPSRS